MNSTPPIMPFICNNESSVDNTNDNLINHPRCYHLMLTLHLAPPYVRSRHQHQNNNLLDKMPSRGPCQKDRPYILSPHRKHKYSPEPGSKAPMNPRYSNPTRPTPRKWDDTHHQQPMGYIKLHTPYQRSHHGTKTHPIFFPQIHHTHPR